MGDMNFSDFLDSLDDAYPPAGTRKELQALWWEAKGEWEQAHQIIQSLTTPEAAWVHAYLHRKEGDEGNAGYWYSRAGRSHCARSLDEEWDGIVQNLLGPDAD